MMKYWKNFNVGWKRLHIVLLIFIPPLLTYLTDPQEDLDVFIRYFLFILLYFITVFIIEWIKEGFKK